MKDTLIFELIEAEKKRQQTGIELIASENFVSPNVLTAAGSILTNKYAEGYPGKRYYGGCEVVDEIENLAIERLKKLFNINYANVQPHSGSQANAAVYGAFMKPGDTILGFDLSHGGHLTHGSPVNFSGKTYRSVFYGLNKETGSIDYDQLEAVAKQEKPKVIVAGASSYSRDFDFKRFREIADKVGAILMADIAHPAGLIATGLLNDPFDHAHIVTSTTHKTLRGPRGGVIMMRNDFESPFGPTLKSGSRKKMSALLNSSVFPGNQGGPLEHVIAAKAVAFGEGLTESYKTYTKQVKDNAATLASNLISKGYNIISGGTDNHMMLIDLRNQGVTGKAAEKALGMADITINKNMVPFDTESPMITSGIRVGTSAITSRGMKEDDMAWITDMLDQVIKNIDNESKYAEVKQEVNQVMSQKPLFTYS